MAEHAKLEEDEKTIITYYETAKNLIDTGDRLRAKDQYNIFIKSAQKFKERSHESKTPDSDTITDALALAYNDLGWLKYLQVDFTGAVADYTKALEICPTLEVAYYNRGLIHYRLGRYDKAIEDQKECLQLNPDFTNAQDCLMQSLTDRETKIKRDSECQ